ncbi:MAG: helix-turn-helix domain-containing protein [Carboxylicivirga sp.]|jgi:AraC-like DNA-binding protein|nr:helix-turn-helix domain-containing protein [Carboxylicivirga sp.]MCT4647997.1 helix-turn-helix domain-containing protein [Carboxylicivirga sp.]
MSDILHLNTIAQVHQLLGIKEKHPLVSVIDFAKVNKVPVELPKLVIGFYCVVFKNDSQCQWKYGRNNYDFQEGTLVFIAPGQALELELQQSGKQKNGSALLIHPDLLLGSNLRLDSPEYSFFSYDVNEALHLSDQEKVTFFEILNQIQKEIAQNIDRHSQRLILSNIELLLNYCIRYYDRQFITRSHKFSDFISRFEKLLIDYFNSELLTDNGLPSVSFCADKLNLSPSYLSDLLKKETGKSTLEHIHLKLIDRAKYLLLNSDDSIRQIAFQLGFEYPQHFNKLFKKQTQMSPKEFRISN